MECWQKILPFLAFGLEVLRHVETVTETVCLCLVETSAVCTNNGNLDLQMKNIEGLTADDQTVEIFWSSSLPAPAAHSVLPLLDAQ